MSSLFPGAWSFGGATPTAFFLWCMDGDWGRAKSSPVGRSSAAASVMCSSRRCRAGEGAVAGAAAGLLVLELLFDVSMSTWTVISIYTAESVEVVRRFNRTRSTGLATFSRARPNTCPGASREVSFRMTYARKGKQRREPERKEGGVEVGASGVPRLGLGMILILALDFFRLTQYCRQYSLTVLPHGVEMRSPPGQTTFPGTVRFGGCCKESLEDSRSHQIGLGLSLPR